MLFPGGRLALRIFEQRYMEMAKRCLRDDSPFGVCLIREGAEVLQPDAPPAVPAEVGCLARIAEWDMPQLGLLLVTARGGERFRILSHTLQADGLMRARVEVLPEEADYPVPAQLSRCARLLERLAAEAPAAVEPPHRFDSSSWVGLRLAELLPLSPQSKQELLEMTDARERLERLSSHLSRARAAF